VLVCREGKLVTSSLPWLASPPSSGAAGGRAQGSLGGGEE